MHKDCRKHRENALLAGSKCLLDNLIGPLLLIINSNDNKKVKPQCRHHDTQHNNIQHTDNQH